MHCRTMACTACLSCERRLERSTTFSCSPFQSRASYSSCVKKKGHQGRGRGMGKGRERVRQGVRQEARVACGRARPRRGKAGRREGRAAHRHHRPPPHLEQRGHRLARGRNVLGHPPLLLHRQQAVDGGLALAARRQRDGGRHVSIYLGLPRDEDMTRERGQGGRVASRAGSTQPQRPASTLPRPPSLQRCV